MADLRDYRMRLDMTLPAYIVEANPQKLEDLKAMLALVFQNAVDINPGAPSAEPGFVELQRCGHRLGLSCTTTDRWEVGKGKVL